MGQKKRRNWASSGQSSATPVNDAAESKELLKDVDGRADDDDVVACPLDVDPSLFIEADRRMQQRQEHAQGEQGDSSPVPSRDISVEMMEDAESGLRRQALEDAGFTPAQLLALSQEEEFVREREEGIAQVHSDVMEVGVIFRELATVVALQDDGFNTIEAETAATAARAKKSTAALAAANSSQKAGRVQYCYLLLVLLIFVMAVILFFKIASR